MRGAAAVKGCKGLNVGARFIEKENVHKDTGWLEIRQMKGFHPKCHIFDSREYTDILQVDFVSCFLDVKWERTLLKH